VRELTYGSLELTNAPNGSTKDNLIDIQYIIVVIQYLQ